MENKSNQCCQSNRIAILRAPYGSTKTVNAILENPASTRGTKGVKFTGFRGTEPQLFILLRENIDAFTATPTDLARRQVVIHTIKTSDAKCLLQTTSDFLCLIPVFAARCQKVFWVGAILPVDPGACLYDLRTVFCLRWKHVAHTCGLLETQCTIGEKRILFANNRSSVTGHLWRKLNTSHR